MEGAHRFLRRLWKTVHAHVSTHKAVTLDAANLNTKQSDLRRKVHQTIRKVDDDYGRRLTFNTAIAAVMELMNDVGRLDEQDDQSIAVPPEALETAILLLSPLCRTFVMNSGVPLATKRRC